MRLDSRDLAFAPVSVTGGGGALTVAGRALRAVARKMIAAAASGRPHGPLGNPTGRQ